MLTQGVQKRLTIYLHIILNNGSVGILQEKFEKQKGQDSHDHLTSLHECVVSVCKPC